MNTATRYMDNNFFIIKTLLTRILTNRFDSCNHSFEQRRHNIHCIIPQILLGNAEDLPANVKEIYQKAADAAGMSLNNFILTAIREKIGM